MDFYSRLPYLKKTLKLTNEDLGLIIGKKADAFRLAIVKKSLKDYDINELEKLFENQNPSTITEPAKPPTKLEDNLIQDYIKTLKQLIEAKDELAVREKKIIFLESEIMRLTKIGKGEI
jgi:predicted RNA-binding protein YlqC (UPF0109 family)